MLEKGVRREVGRERRRGGAPVHRPRGRLHASPLGLPIGSQTWPHRQRIKDGDFAGLCKDMAALGIGDVELCSPAYAEFGSLADAKQTRKILEDHGLKCSSAHVTMERAPDEAGRR